MYISLYTGLLYLVTQEPMSPGSLAGPHWHHHHSGSARPLAALASPAPLIATSFATRDRAIYYLFSVLKLRPN